MSFSAEKLPLKRNSGMIHSPAEPKGALWWTERASNPRHPACKAGALPTELSDQEEDWSGRNRSGCTGRFRATVCPALSISRTGSCPKSPDRIGGHGTCQKQPWNNNLSEVVLPWRGRLDSNQQPAGSKPVARPIELRPSWTSVYGPLLAICALHRALLSRLHEKLERIEGIEPASSAWKAAALPLSYTRMKVNKTGGRRSIRNPNLSVPSAFETVPARLSGSSSYFWRKT